MKFFLIKEIPKDLEKIFFPLGIYPGKNILVKKKIPFTNTTIIEVDKITYAISNSLFFKLKLDEKD